MSERRKRRPSGRRRKPLGKMRIERSYDQLRGLGGVPARERVLVPEHQILRFVLPEMRAACRYVHREKGVGANADRLLRAGILGSRTPMPVLREAADLPEDTVRRVMSAWRKWAENPDMCDYQGEASLLTHLGTAVGHILADGECFFRTREGGTGNPLRLELVDPGRIPLFDHANVTTGSILGVMHTPEGRRLSYIVYDIPLDNTSGSLYRSTTLSNVPADFILHWRIPLRAQAVRGMPLLYPVAVQADLLDDFNVAAAANARLNATRVGIFQEGDGSTGFSGDGADTEEEEFDEEGEEDDTAEAQPERVTVPWLDGDIRLQGPQMPRDTSMTPWPSTFPTQAVEAFNRSMTQQMAAALGLAHDALSGDLKGVNFSAGRLGRLAERKTFLQMRVYLIEQVLNPTWERFVGGMLAAGALPGVRPADFDRLMSVDWPPPPADPVDIKAQAAVDETYLTLGVKSRSEVIRGMGGVPEDVFAEIAMEKEKLGDMPGREPIIQPEPDEGDEAGGEDADEGDAGADEDE